MSRSVRARLAELRDNWPPPDYTVKKSGVSCLLQELVDYGDRAALAPWASLTGGTISRTPNLRWSCTSRGKLDRRANEPSCRALRAQRIDGRVGPVPAIAE